MKYLKNISDFELRVQRVEKLMEDLEIRIEFNGIRPFVFDYKNNKTYELYDIESGDQPCSFPRSLESEKICVID